MGCLCPAPATTEGYPPLLQMGSHTPQKAGDTPEHTHTVLLSFSLPASLYLLSHTPPYEAVSVASAFTTPVTTRNVPSNNTDWNITQVSK